LHRHVLSVDCRFDNFGAGENGRNWKISGSGDVAFRKPNHRPFPLALARRIAAPGHAWSGALYGVWTDRNHDGQWNDGELRRFRIDRSNDVAFVQFTAFSDAAARNNNYFGVEVAMMRWSDALAGPPHYNHDFSFEAMLRFPSRSDEQLDANVRNIPTICRQANWNGPASPSVLTQAYESVVIWRDRPGREKTNCEQWGSLRHSDSDCDAGMHSYSSTTNAFAEFDHILITLFRSGFPNGFLIRDGVSTNDAQVGITHVEVGITSRADFNLDYRVDADDARIMRSNWLTRAVATLRTGDADNDTDVDLDDALALAAFWTVPAAKPGAASATYDPATGRIVLAMNGICCFKLTAGDGAFANTPPAFAPLSATVQSVAPAVLGAFSTNAWTGTFDLGPIAPTNRPASDFRLQTAWFGCNRPMGIETRVRSPGP
jgi:hypothetical protein